MFICRDCTIWQCSNFLWGRVEIVYFRSHLKFEIETLLIQTIVRFMCECMNKLFMYDHDPCIQITLSLSLRLTLHKKADYIKRISERNDAECRRINQLEIMKRKLYVKSRQERNTRSILDASKILSVRLLDKVLRKNCILSS